MRTFDLNGRLLERLSCFQQPLHALVKCLNVFPFDFILFLLGVFVSTCLWALVKEEFLSPFGADSEAYLI